MCTVVVRWAPGAPVQVLALRDELVGRDFDDPAAWWPEQPSVVGGRDRSAGGSWCVTDVTTGTSGLVLNRFERLVGTPSRGLLPLLAVRHGSDWVQHLDVTGMASFTLLLAAPDRLVQWSFDGASLTSQALGPGTHMVTSGGEETGKVARYLDTFTQAAYPEEWLQLLRESAPSADLEALVVRRERDGSVYATVFGQLFSSAPGRLDLTWSRTPWGDGPWESYA